MIQVPTGIKPDTYCNFFQKAVKDMSAYEFHDYLFNNYREYMDMIEVATHYLQGDGTVDHAVKIWNQVMEGGN